MRCSSSIRANAVVPVSSFLQEAIPLQKDAAANDNGLGFYIDRLHKGAIRQRIQKG